jgi:hypothetical protein
VALPLLALAAFHFREPLERFERERSYHAQERVRLQLEEASARLCIEELSKRDPAVDAERDFGRGDQTPIGLTYKPHDPPDPSTLYPGACKHEYYGEYRPTGKWFTYWSDGYSFLGRSASYGKCRRVAHAYAERYNRRATELAPDAVWKFCRSQKLAASARLGVASVAILGTTRAQQETIEGRAYRTKASWVVDTPFGPVLVTKSYAPDQDPDCSNCEAVVGVAYLKEHGALIEARRRWPLVWSRDPKADRGGDLGGGLSLNDQLTSYPILGVNRRQFPARSPCWLETWIELRPDGPVNRGTVYSHASGHFENVQRDIAFDLVFPGDRTPQRYEMKGGRFVGPSKHPRC